MSVIEDINIFNLLRDKNEKNDKLLYNYMHKNGLNIKLGNRNLLYYVIKYDRDDILRYMIDNGVNLYDNICGSCLHQAVILNNLDLVKMIKDYVDIDSVDDFNWTPINYSIKNGNNEIFIYLVNHGANLYKLDNNKCSVLHLAIEYRRVFMVEYLVQDEKLCNIYDKYNRNVSRYINDLNVMYKNFEEEYNLLVKIKEIYDNRNKYKSIEI